LFLSARDLAIRAGNGPPATARTFFAFWYRRPTTHLACGFLQGERGIARTDRGSSGWTAGALERHGFKVARVTGSHHILRHPDGRGTKPKRYQDAAWGSSNVPAAGRRKRWWGGSHGATFGRLHAWPACHAGRMWHCGNRGLLDPVAGLVVV